MVGASRVSRTLPDPTAEHGAGRAWLRGAGIRRKLAVAMVLALLVFFGTLGVFAVSEIAGVTRAKVNSEALDRVDLAAHRIQSFFAERGRIVTTMVESPDLLGFFSGYNTFQRSVQNDPQYRQVTEYLRRIVDSDPTVLSAFFATASTGEYFKSDGRVEREGYDTRDRWWWEEAVKNDRLYVSRPGVDANTGDVAVTLQTTVHRPDGSLLGVAGADVLLTTVGDLVRQIKYQGQGTAFLVDSESRVIYFPGMEVKDSLETTLPQLDEDRTFKDTSGFAELTRVMTAGERGIADLRFQGHATRVLYTPVRSDSPGLDWSLGLMVPQELISAPIRRATTFSIIGLLVSIAAVCGLTLFVASVVVTRPVGGLVARFRDIAEGKGDLTQRVEVTSGDELGELGSLFNSFVASIQKDMESVAELSSTLAAASEQLNSLSQQIASSTEETSTQAGVVSAAAEQVSTNVQTVATSSEEMSASIREIAKSAGEAAKVAGDAVRIADDTTSRFVELGEAGKRIGSIVEVIHSIAEQTNLLALNATIEAARAGEAGKGFAVVAGEVKELANQTARATGEIAETVKAIQSHTDSAGGSIREVTEIINQIHEIQVVIASAVEEQSATTSEIGRNVADAARGTGEIAQSISSFAEVAYHTASGANSIQQAAQDLARTAANLQQIVSRFNL